MVTAESLKDKASSPFLLETWGAVFVFPFGPGWEGGEHGLDLPDPLDCRHYE